MANPVETDCDEDYKRCKSKCFDMLVAALAEAGGDVQKEEGAKNRYEAGLALCKKAKTICDGEPV